MISIDKTYYSEYTEQIHIILYNSEPDVTTFEMSLPDNINLNKVVDAQSYGYLADYSITYFNETSLGSDEYFSAHVIININTDIAAVSDEYPEFTIAGLTGMSIVTTSGELSSAILEPSELYTFKMAIVEAESGYQGGVKTAKKMSRFSFYEQMLINAIELGYLLDANKFYLELKRMSEYGIPKVNRDICYI